MGYFGGLVEGFQGRREEEYQRNFEADAQARAQEGKIFEYLLQSRDPEIAALAMSGLFESARPGKRKGGLKGFMGEVQGGSFYPQILARMNQQVPDTGTGGGPAPPQPGAAAMSTNQTTRPGSQPLAMTPPPPTEIAQPPGFAGPPSPVDTAQMQPTMVPPGAGMPPPGPPPVSKWKRLGTGIPTAEEIVETSAAAQIQGRIQAITQALQATGAPPEAIQRAILGIAGAPPPMDTTSNGPVLASPEDPDTPIPTVRHRDGTITLIDGTPVPPTLVGYVKPSASGQLTRTIRDPQSPSGYSAVSYLPGGAEFRRVPTEFVPPPAFAGTTEILEPGTNVPVRAGVPREGGAPIPIGDAPGTVESQTMTDAKALVDIINRRVQEERRAGLPVRPGARDAVAREEATKLGLPFKTYAEVERAARSTPEVTPREQSQGGSLGERLRARALGGAATAPPPPAQPSVRSSGPGPRR